MIDVSLNPSIINLFFKGSRWVHVNCDPDPISLSSETPYFCPECRSLRGKFENTEAFKQSYPTSKKRRRVPKKHFPISPTENNGSNYSLMGTNQPTSNPKIIKKHTITVQPDEVVQDSSDSDSGYRSTVKKRQYPIDIEEVKRVYKKFKKVSSNFGCLLAVCECEIKYFSVLEREYKSETD